MVVPRNDSRPGATVNNRRARACSDPGRASDTESASTTAQEHFIASTQARTSHMSQVDGPEWSLKSGFVDISGDIEGNGTGYNNTKVDIVGVPCPGASPLRTWMTPDESVTALAAGPQPSSSNVSDPFGLATPDRQQMWIREGIRKSISTARILLYGHRTLDDGINMAELADDLLLQLFEERQKFKQPRPLFFMCHSIGGLIVKIALVKARDDPKYHSILYDCYGLVFFATPHRGSSYLSMPNLRDSIEHLMHLERPLPLSITENLRLNHQKLVKLHEQFKDIASEMYVWTFYETEDSLLSGYADADFDEVHFSAPLASIKSTLVECRHEQAFSLECKHGECASFGTKNEKLKSLFLKDLGQAVQKAQDLAAVEHVPLNLGEHVKLDLIGFYDDPDSDTESDVRMYVSKPRLNDFLHMGPEECLKERLKGMAPKPRRASSITQKDSRLISSGGLAIRLGAALQDGRSKVQSMWAAMSPDMGSASDVSLPSGTPEIVVNSPSVSDLRGTVSNPPQVPRNALNLSIPSLWTPRTSRSGSRTVSLDERRPSSAFDPPPFHNNSKNDVTVSRISNAHTVGKGDANPGATSQKRPAGIRRASGFEDFPAGFSRPKANERKFMWIHLPYTNPHWVKKIFEKMAEVQSPIYNSLLSDKYWSARHVKGRHGQANASFVKPGCGFVPSLNHSPNPSSPGASGRSSPVGAWPSHLYLFLPYLHFDTYINLIRRRTIVRERQKRGRTRPVPRPVANMSSLDVKVIWEFIDHDPPLNTRRTLDRYGYPTLTDTWARDDDQMMYKLTKAGNTNLFDVSRISSTTSNDMMEQSPLSPPSPYSARSAVAEPKQAPETGQKSQFDFDENILDGNVLMVDQLWLWAVDMKTLTTFFPKRDSHPTEGPMFQQGDLRNSVYNELNGDLTGRCENALDLAAFVTLHAVTVLLDRTSHPDLEIFRIFDEAISMLTERLTSSLKRFRMQTFRNRIHESDEDDSDHNDTRSETIRQRHEREIAQAERENKENTSALLELRDMDDELKTLNRLFEEQRTVVTKMQELYEKPELLRETEHGRKYLQEASEKIGEYEGQVADMLRRIETTRDDYEKFLNMVQRKAQVDEVRWNRLQVELSKTQNLSVIIFTAFTVIFLPLSFFTSLFGMNTSNWAGDEGSDYKSLQEIGAVSLPISLAIIVLALVAAFSSRVQDAVGSLFKVLKGGWGETRRLETERLIESRKERNYDFWDTVRRERPTTYNIPNVNKVTPTQHHLTRRSTWRSGHWKDKSLGTERKY